MLRRAFLIGFVLAVATWANPLAQTVEPSFTYLYPRVEYGEGWETSIVILNSACHDIYLRVLDTRGDTALIKLVRSVQVHHRI